MNPKSLTPRVKKRWDGIHPALLGEVSFSLLLSKLNIFFILLVILPPLGGCQRSGFKSDDGPQREGDVSVSYYRDKLADPLIAQKLDLSIQPKKKVLVLKFWNSTPIQVDYLGGFITEELQRGLIQSQRVLFPTEIKSFPSTEDFVEGERVKVAQLIREGRKLGVAGLVIGRITRIVFRQRGDDVGLLREKQSLASVELEVKVFDIQAGRESLSMVRSSEVSNKSVVVFDSTDIDSPAFRSELTKAAAREASSDFVPEILKVLDKMTWEGHIARIAGNKVYVNAGSESGLAVGDILRVFNPGEDIYDPVTDALLGRSPGQLKGTLEVVDFMTNDGAVTDIHTGGNFKDGDLVQLY